MDKVNILTEIKRTAAVNGGKPLGFIRFFQQTGIRKADWFGVFWARWGDALKEAGFVPNELTQAYGKPKLLEFLINFSLELGRLPTNSDLKLKATNEAGFPNAKTFEKAFGTKAKLVAALKAHCAGRSECLKIVEWCEQYRPPLREAAPEAAVLNETQIGYVYLLKAGRFYKIGRTNSDGRREYELAIQLPERAEKIHVIRTDDPVGIEAYWHKRFEEKRRNGEWFELDLSEVAIFKRRTFM